MNAATSSHPAPQYHGDNKLVLGIVLAVVTFWLFAQTTLNVAPTMRDDLRIAESVNNIAVSITALFSGIFIVIAGGLADRFGRVKLTNVGIVFGVLASLLIALSPVGTATFLLIGRVIQGISAACIMPSTLALMKAYFDGEARQRALSFWSIGSWGGSGLSPLFGGFVASTIGWRWIFFMSVAVALVSLLLLRGTRRLDARSRRCRAVVLASGPFDGWLPNRCSCHDSRWRKAASENGPQKADAARLLDYRCRHFVDDPDVPVGGPVPRHCDRRIYAIWRRVGPLRDPINGRRALECSAGKRRVCVWYLQDGILARRRPRRRSLRGDLRRVESTGRIPAFCGNRDGQDREHQRTVRSLHGADVQCVHGGDRHHRHHGNGAQARSSTATHCAEQFGRNAERARYRAETRGQCWWNGATATTRESMR